MEWTRESQGEITTPASAHTGRAPGRSRRGKKALKLGYDSRPSAGSERATEEARTEARVGPGRGGPGSRRSARDAVIRERTGREKARTNSRSPKSRGRAMDGTHRSPGGRFERRRRVRYRSPPAPRGREGGPRMDTLSLTKELEPKVFSS